MGVKLYWLKRRWFDFRMGHNIYLSFLLSFMNFLLISYTFLVSQIPFLNELFPGILEFAVVGALVYVPTSVAIGHFHNKKQLGTDLLIQAEKNPYFERIFKRLDTIEKKLENLERKTDQGWKQKMHENLDKKVWFDELTMPEAEQAAKEGKVVIIPCGSIE